MAVIPYTERFSGVPTTLVSDRDGNLYGVSGGDVIQYHGVAGTSDNLGFPGDNIQSIAWFNGYLHCLWWNGSNVLSDLTDLGVSYYNGFSWVQTLSKPTGAIGAFLQAAYLMALRDIVMVAHIGAFDNAAQFITPVIKYTTDGSSWAQGTVDGNNNVFLQPNVNGVPVLYTDTIYMDGNTDHLNVTPPFTTSLWKWAGNDWIVYDASYSTRVSGSFPRLRAGYIDKYWQAPSSGASEYSDDLLNWTANPPDGSGTITPFDGDNLPWSWGYFFNGVSFYMVPWDDDGLAWLNDDFDIYNRTTYGLPVKMFRMDDGKVFVVTAGGYILQRDVDIPEGPDWPVIPITGRLWIYKTLDKGITWTSRGVTT